MPKDTIKKKRELGVILEDIESGVKNVLEGNEANAKRLDLLEGVPDKLDNIETRLDSMETSLGNIHDRIGTVETILESVNLPALKQKIATHEKRLDALEAKAK